jgi:hypothetical protein
MRSRRRPHRDATDTTKPYAMPMHAPNYSGDDSETLIRVLPLPLREDDDEGADELTRRHASIH